MGVTSVQGFKFKLVANGEILDLFADEEIKVSDNITGLFDLGVLPADFTKTMTLPGSKKNNHFFEFVWDISVENPYTFATNLKVPCYMDFDGIYLTDGYIQLNKVNLYQNKYVDSYEVTIYGGLASFGRDLKRYFLTDLTSSLAKFNHTSSLENITGSWDGKLFSGSIVYPMAEYGQKIQYQNTGNELFGINSKNGALCVEDYKPAIRVKEVWDACFEQFGYTYTSSFMSEPFWDNMYMLCNNKLRYPIYSSSLYPSESIDLETYGLFRISPISDVAGQTNVTMSANIDLLLPWYNIESNPGGNLNSTLDYSLDFNTKIRGNLNLNFEISSSYQCVPHFQLKAKNIASSVSYSVDLINYNNFMNQTYAYNANDSTRPQTFTLLTQFDTPVLPSGSYNFYLTYTPYPNSSDNVRVVIDPGGTTNSYLEITKVNQGADGRVLVISDNMPQGPGTTNAGTNGVKLIDFITSIQKKFNLVIYPNKTKLNEFIVEPFNRWYKEGSIKNFNSYINLNDIITATPANNLAVQNLSFSDTLDGDYVSQQFSKAASREYGRANYIDTENFYSQGNFDVKTTLASSPLLYLSGTGTSGSGVVATAGFRASANAVGGDSSGCTAYSNISIGTTLIVNAIAITGPRGTDSKVDPLTGYTYANVYEGSQIIYNASAEGIVASTSFSKFVNGVETILSTGNNFTYTITLADLTATTLTFEASANSETA